MSAPIQFKTGQRVALASDTSCRGSITRVIIGYTSGDPESYDVSWDKHGTYLYFGEMLVLESELEKR
jgi:hypothetical protein